MNIPIRIALAAAALTLAGEAGAQECEWSPLRRGLDPGFTGASVNALTVFDDGSGEALYVGGDFQVADRTIVNYIAKWDGSAWSALGAGVDGLVVSLAVFDDGRGGGQALYAGGTLTGGVARWNGATWTEVGGGVAGGSHATPMVGSMAVFDDGSGPALYVAGDFDAAGGTPETARIARWDGESWSSVGGGVGPSPPWLGVIDDGSGPALYATGRFTQAGGAPARYLAKWDGQSWSEIPGFDNWALPAEFDDGAGSVLYAAGAFTTAGGVPARYVARWDGENWSEIEGGPNEPVTALAVFDDGAGPALYMGGGFTMAGGAPANCIARWDGSEWASLGAGIGGTSGPDVVELAVYDDGGGPALYAGGHFLSAGGEPANYIARWRCEQPPACPADCDASGALDFLDFLCFQNAFAAADPLADCDGSTTLDFFDFLCFQNAFTAGCP